MSGFFKFCQEAWHVFDDFGCPPAAVSTVTGMGASFPIGKRDFPQVKSACFTQGGRCDKNNKIFIKNKKIVNKTFRFL